MVAAKVALEDNSRRRALIFVRMTPTDPFRNKGAVEQQAPQQDGNESQRGQLGHRNQDPLVKSNDAGMPEPGENPEHTGEPELGSLYMRDEPEEQDPEGAEQDPDPGQRQKRNQGDEKEDPLAA